jgi:hypothetical protein
MDMIGLINNISSAVDYLANGRKGFATKGEEREGRVLYETGISMALASFKEVHALADPKTIMLAEEAFLQKELDFCAENDDDARNSLEMALQSFDDAFLCLEVVEEPVYVFAEKTHPHSKKYRIQGFPKDAFHVACLAHYTRLSNVLRSPGIDMIEKAVLEQRAANMKIAQRSYIEKQKVIMNVLG